LNTNHTKLTMNLIAVLILMTILTMPTVIAYDPPIEPMPTSSYERYGPRVNDLIFSAWGSSIAEADALQAGDIDLMDWATPSSKLDPLGDDWRWMNEITLGDYSEYGFYEMDINCMQWPTGHGDMVPPGWTGSEPAVVTGHYWHEPDTCQRCYDARQFRRALAHLTDRTAMVNNMGGYAAAMETFIFPGIAAWENPAAPKYAYSPTLAEAALLAGGFADWDGDTVMEYSPGHDGNLTELEDLPQLMGWIRSDDPDRTFAGELLRDELIKLGIPQDFRIAGRGECYNHAWVTYDYHVYTGGWDWGRTPDMYSELWASYKDTYPSSGADNYNRYHRASYDVQADGFKSATTSAAAEAYCDAMQVILHDDAACIPIYTFAGYLARSTRYAAHPGEAVYYNETWVGAVNELGDSYYSIWSPLNMHPETFQKGGTLRQGLIVPIEKWSAIHAEWFYDWLILQQIYSYLLDAHPLDATQFVPNLAIDLPTVSSYSYDGHSGSRLSFELVPNVHWHNSTPGDVKLVTPEDVGFSFSYSKSQVSVDHYWAVKDFYTYITPLNGSGWWGPQLPPNTVDILFEVESWLATDWAAGVPIIPMEIWSGKDASSWNPEDHDAVIGSGPFMCNKDGVPGRIDVTEPDEYVHLEANPTYFRRYIWPDVCNDVPAPVRDLQVKISDFIQVSLNAFTYDTRLPGYEFYPAWDAGWVVDYDQLLDVTKNGAIDSFDLVEIGVRLGQTWPPSYYEFIPPTP
jgi:hypothetical protein